MVQNIIIAPIRCATPGIRIIFTNRILPMEWLEPVLRDTWDAEIVFKRKERKGKERKGKERKGRERKGKERKNK
jgi:hypothetical protein